MTYTKLSLSAIILSVLWLTSLQAQESINATGGNASGTGGSVSYSVGQTLYTTNTGTNGAIAEGVQQPYEISVVTAIEESVGINLTVTAYPNPTPDFLLLNIEEFNISDLSYYLHNMQGKLMQSEKITGNQTSIPMSHLDPGLYFVRVLKGNQEAKIFKIIKK